MNSPWLSTVWSILHVYLFRFFYIFVWMDFRLMFKVKVNDSVAFRRRRRWKPNRLEIRVITLKNLRWARNKEKCHLRKKKLKNDDSWKMTIFDRVKAQKIREVQFFLACHVWVCHMWCTLFLRDQKCDCKVNCDGTPLDNKS